MKLEHIISIISLFSPKAKPKLKQIPVSVCFFFFDVIASLQILHHLDQAWDLRWKNLLPNNARDIIEQNVLSDPHIPAAAQVC